MRLGYVIQYVADVDATLTFYERAFGLSRRFLSDDNNRGERETGDRPLAFAAAPFVRTIMPVDFTAAEPHGSAPPFELGLVTEDVEADYRRAVSAGAVEVKPPQKKPW